MQKWEYMTAHIVNMRASGQIGSSMVLMNNDRPIGEVKWTLNGEGKIFGGELLGNFLFRVGLEGWEVVSSNSLGDNYATLLVLKRPKE